MAYMLFFNDTATTEIYTLSLHDALPIFKLKELVEEGKANPKFIIACPVGFVGAAECKVEIEKLNIPMITVRGRKGGSGDRKSTRLNSSHANISYAVFCLIINKILVIAVL